MDEAAAAHGITRREPQGIQREVDEFTRGLTAFLDSLKLPAANVLVAPNERAKVINNLPGVVELLPDKVRVDAAYISKFVAACAVGLFDAALNFLWDETVASLRKKVALFDLEYFYNSVVTDPKRRSKLSTPEDLKELEDWELIRGCHLTGVLSDVGFLHLDYIRNMRNWASAAHPNQNQLTGLQLVGWLDTCIREVIGKEPEGPVIEVRRLLHNVRNSVLSSKDIPPIAANIDLLQPDLATSLLRTTFGMFTDPNVAAQVKSNIKLIASNVWKRAPEGSRHEAGLRFATFAANADIPRRDAAREFLEAVGGLSYLPPDAFTLELGERIANLMAAYLGYNNFFNEPAHAKALLALVPPTGVIPEGVRESYVKTVMMCRVGNGYGVSFMAAPYYDELIQRFQEKEVFQVLRLVNDLDFRSRLRFQGCEREFRNICGGLRTKTSNPHAIAVLDAILAAPQTKLNMVGGLPEVRSALTALGL